MRAHHQQVIGSFSVRNFSALALLVGLWGLFLGCEGPIGRDKPWRDKPILEPLPARGAHDTVGKLLHSPEKVDRSRSLRIQMDASPGSLNPLRNPSVWGLRITRDTVFESLIWYRAPEDPSLAGNYESGLAKSWIVSPGGREIRFALHEDARFHDGTKVSALDVQFSIESAIFARGGAEHHRRALSDLSSVEIVSKSHVRVRLERPNAFVLRELASVPILPEHYYRKRLDQRKGEWIGSGPYKIASETPKGVVLERDPKYWGEAPVIDRIQFVRQPDAAIALREAKEGQVDIVPALIAEHYPQQLRVPGVYEKFSVLNLAPPVFSYLGLQTQQPPFDDVNVRRALAQLIDRKALIESASGLDRSVSGPIWHGGPGNGHAPDVLPMDLQEAARLLEVAGWRDEEGDGVRSREGHRLMIRILATEGTHPVRDLVVSALRKAGFVLDIRVGSPAVLLNRLKNGEFNLAFLSWSGDSDRDLSALFATRGHENFGGFSDPAVDAHLHRIQATTELSERKKLVSEFATLLQQRMPVVALPSHYPYGIISKRVQGISLWNGWLRLRELRLIEPKALP